MNSFLEMDFGRYFKCRKSFSVYMSSCIEHYQCLRGSTLITDGNVGNFSDNLQLRYLMQSQTRIVSVVTTVNTYTTVPGASFSYNYSIIDATDKKCETYTKVGKSTTLQTF